ncbi:Bromodomain containing protein 7, partial [Perkinsus olseni]
MVLTPARKRQNSEPAACEASTAHDRPEDTLQAKRRRTGGSHNPQVFGISQRQWRQKSYRDLCAVMLRWMRSKDRNQFFYFPVDVNEVPTYRDIIKNPMSFDLMEARASKRAYKTVGDIQKDFKLICKNAMTFNPEGSIWYRAAEKLLAEGEKQFDLAQLHGLRLPDESMESATGAATSRAGSRRSYTRRDHGIFISKALDEALLEVVFPGTTQMHRNSTEVEKIPPSIRSAMHGIEYNGTPLNMTKDLLEAYANVVEENRFSNRGAPNMLVRVGPSTNFSTNPGKAGGSSVLPGELEPKSAEKSMRRFLDGIDGLPEDLVERHLRKRLDGCKSVVAPLNDCRVFGLDTEDF